MSSDIAEAVRSGILGQRVWFYATYRCNLVCTYCLTESGPSVTKREMNPAQMIRLAEQATELGFQSLGITGGEPLMLPWMVDTAAAMSRILPLVLLTNATLLRGHRLERITSAFAGHDIQLQISLDSADPEVNDEFRGESNFVSVTSIVPKLVDRGLRVRIATTSETITDHELGRLFELRRSWGIADEHHIVRPIVARGRAVLEHQGVEAGIADLQPELCITAEGAFWSAFGPTVKNGRLDTDLLVTRTIEPLRVPAAAMLRLAEGRPRGADSLLNIR
jgi:MoaA/NifB/PqqE/SkfB family radical SAM enzyme